jgi:hypothetical protein
MASSYQFKRPIRLCREFRHEPPDAPWNTAATFDAIYKVATAKGIRVEF